MILDEYKKDNPNLEKRLTRMEDSTKIAEILLSIKDSEGVTKLMEMLENDVNSINAKLLSYDTLTEVERECLLTDKERCMWLSHVFGRQEQILESTNKFIKTL